MNSRLTSQLKARAQQRALAAGIPAGVGTASNPVQPTLAIPPLPALQWHDWPLIALVCISHFWLANMFAHPAATAKSSQNFSANKRIEVSLLKKSSPPTAAATANTSTSPDVASTSDLTIAPISSHPIDSAETSKEISAPTPITATLPTNPASDETALALNYTARYFHSKELSEKPRLLQDIRREMAIAISGAQAQNLILLLLINEQGKIDKVELEKTDLPQEIAEQVSKAFLDLRFVPGKIDGLAVKSLLKIEVRLENSQATRAPLRLGGQINPRSVNATEPPSDTTDSKSPAQ